MDQQQERKLYSKLGSIDKWLENIDDHLEKLNNKTEKNSKDIQRHDVFIGKVGMITAFIASVASAVIIGIINAWSKFSQ